MLTPSPLVAALWLYFMTEGWRSIPIIGPSLPTAPTSELAKIIAAYLAALVATWVISKLWQETKKLLAKRA